MLSYTATILCLLLNLGIFEILADSKKCSPPCLRKLVHVVTSAIVMVCSLMFTHNIFIFVGIFFGCGILLLRQKRPLRSLADRAESSYGDVLYPFGIAFCALISENTTNFATTVAVLGLSDTLAYVVGKNISSPKLLFSKSLLGSGAFAVSSLLIMAPFLQIWPAVFASIAMTFVEIVSPKGSDNFTIPLVGAVVLNVAG